MNDRITGKLQDGTVFVRSETGNEGVGHFTTQRRLPEIIIKLAKLEDKIENGELVEVIRCKNCVFCKYNESSGFYKCTTTKGRFGVVKADDFCSFGERKKSK